MSEERRSSQSLQRPGSNSRRVSWGSNVVINAPGSTSRSSPSGSGRRGSVDHTENIGGGGRYHFRGSRPPHSPLSADQQRRGSTGHSPGTPTSSLSRGRTDRTPDVRRPSTTDYFASSREGSRRSSASESSPRHRPGGSAGSDASPRGAETGEGLWSIKFDCSKYDDDERKAPEYRMWFPKRFTVQEVIASCPFTDKEIKPPWSKGPADEDGNEVFILHRNCGSDRGGHADCQAPLDPSRLTSAEVEDPQGRYLIRRCVKTEYDKKAPSNSFPHIKYFSFGFPLESENWTQEYRQGQREVRRQREDYHRSIADHAVLLRNAEHQTIQDSASQISNHAQDANKLMERFLNDFDKSMSTFTGEPNDQDSDELQIFKKAMQDKAKNLHGIMQQQLDNVRSDFDSLKSDATNVSNASKRLQGIDYHEGFEIDLRDKTIGRLRRERDDWRDKAKSGQRRGSR